MDNDKVVKVLNHLIQTCKDGEAGYREAAEDVNDPELRTLFNRHAQQRAGYAAELSQEVIRLGGDPEDTGGVAAALHRAWTNVKQALSGNDRDAVLAEVERGEGSAIETYEDALKQSLPQFLIDKVKTQHEGIVEARRDISALRTTT